MAITQENTTEIVSSQENEFVAISQFQAKIIELLRKNSLLNLSQISEHVGFSTTVVETAVTRLINKKLIVENDGRYSINVKKQVQDLSLVDRTYQSASLGNNQVLLSQLGIHLKRINPTFDVRAYNFDSLSEYLRAQQGYLLTDNNINGYNHPIVKKK